MITMKISAFVVSWNKKKDVDELLTSLENQIRKPDELFVVDNGSWNGTKKVIKKHGVLLISMPRPVGACETFNIGFKLAKYDLVAFFDDDVVLREDWFEQMEKAIQKEPEETAIFSSHVVFSPPLNSPKDVYPYFIDGFEGCAGVIRKSILRKIGYYDEKFHIYVNERDLSHRLLNRGYKIRYIPDAVVLHKRGPNIRVGPRSLFYHTRNRLWIYVKYYPLKKMIFSSIKFTLKTFIESLKQGLTPVFFQAIFSALLGLGYCIKQREVSTWLNR